MRTLILVCVFGLLAHVVGASDKPAWNVEEAFGPTKPYEFKTQEGTWMSLDISPDGQTIVFDLLGDLYVLPIAGGKATALTKGLALDLQPRFSPDGKTISFTSDRGGGDNIWLMNADGSNLRQVTKESFRLLNNATWTPDNKFLIARKHFTSTRSLGAGELWMYHRSGGKGIQLTKRKNDQQDLGEPSVSPDGRYVYFSEDISPAGFFDYNRNPHSGIYAIKRLDLQLGTTETVVSGPGGAVRPQISPNGKQLAFVKRLAEKSVLHVADLDSGASVPVYEHLSKDQQEAWAIFGVYPGFAWLPDSSGLVFWAKGGLHSLNLASGTHSKIPFEAQVVGEVIESVRTKPSLDDTRARVIRQAATSPDGQYLVFHALGKLWKKKLPNGTPQRLTGDDGFEYEPAFSPNGKDVVYIRWRDSEQAVVCVIGLNGRRQKVLNTGKGFFFEPSYSADGKAVIYRKGSGNRLLGNLYSGKRGIYRIATRGGEPKQVTSRGRQPYESSDGKRIYFLDGFGQNKGYYSVSIDGHDLSKHLSLRYVTDLVPSPTGQWLAFREGFNVFVASFPKTGRTFELSSTTKALPVQQVSSEVGSAIHWSSEDKRLHWLAGDRYHTADIPDLPLKGNHQLPKGGNAGIAVELDYTLDVPAGSVALTNARLITMKGDEVIENGTIVVEGNRIVAIGTSANVQLPAAALVLDMAGKTIMPGIVDVHGHASHFSSGPSPQTNWAYYANLALGVTALHDPSANTETVFAQSELVRAGEIVGPRIFSTGTILYGADGDIRAVINSLDDAVAHVRRLKTYGAFSLKSYNQPRRNQRQMILKAARDQNMLVVNEGGSTFAHNLTMLLDGTTGIEHNLPIAPLYNDVVRLWAETDVRYTPTLVVSFGGVSGEYYWYQHQDVWNHPQMKTFYPPEIMARRARWRMKLPEEEYYHIEVAKSAKKLLDAGVKVNIGGHGQVQGLAAHWEMWMLAQGGFTPMEVLRAATLHGADYIGLADQFGSLEPGKLADLIVLNKNPLDNIRNSDKIHAVMANGRLYDAATMNEIGNHPKTRPAFLWEAHPGKVIFGSLAGETSHCSCRPGGGAH